MKALLVGLVGVLLLQKPATARTLRSPFDVHADDSSKALDSSSFVTLAFEEHLEKSASGKTTEIAATDDSSSVYWKSSNILRENGSIRPPPECRSFHTNSSRYNLLACWLFYLKVGIPDQSFHSSIFTLRLKHLECTNFTIGSLESEYRSSNRTAGDDDPYLVFAIKNASALCHGHYYSSGLSGDMTAHAVGMDHAVELSLRVISSANNTNSSLPASNATPTFTRPTALKTVHCETNVEVQDLDFSGSMSAKVVEMFRHRIAKYVSTALQEQLCPVLPGLVDPWLTQQLQNLNQWLDQYLFPPPPVSNDIGKQRETGVNVAAATSRRTGVSYGSNLDVSSSIFVSGSTSDGDSKAPRNTVDFTRDIPFFAQATSWINRVALEPHLHEGFLPHDWLNDSKKSQLGHGVHDDKCIHCGGFFDGWNGVARSFSPQLRVPLPPSWQNIRFVIPSYGAVELQLQNLTVASGLDEWNRLVVLEIQDAHTLSSAAQSQNVSIRTDMKIVVQAIPGGIFQGDDLEEAFSIQINATSLGGELDLGVFLHRDSLQSIPVETLIDLVHGLVERNGTSSRQALACLLPAVQSVQATDLTVNVVLADAFFEPHVPTPAGTTSQLEHDLDAVVNNVLQLVLLEYQQLVTATVVGLTQGPARDALNHYLDNITAVSEDKLSGCEPKKGLLTQKSLNFTGALIRLNRFLSRNDTLTRVNRHIDCISNFLSHVVENKLSSGPRMFDNSRTNDVDEDEQLFQLLVFQLKDTGSVRNMQLLSPESNRDYLTSSLTYGNISEQDRPRLFAAAKVRYAPLNITASIDLELSLNDVDVTGGSAFSYDSGQLGRMGILQLLQHRECALAPANLKFYNVGSSLGQFKALVHTTLSSPMWNETVNITFNSQDYPSIGGVTSYGFEWIVTSIHDMFQATSRAVFSDAYDICEGEAPPDEREDDDGLDYPSIFLIIGAVLLFSQPAFLLIKRNPDPMVNEADIDVRDQSLEVPLLQDHAPDMNAVENVATQPARGPTSLMTSPNISYFVRIMVPMLILSTIFLLLSSNLSVGATVDLVATLDERSFRTPPLFSFSLFNTAKEMFQARIYPLFFLVVVFSGIWPYVKLLLLLLAWVSPKSFLSARRRGKLLLALDSLGKFSLVDTYVLVLMMVAFRYHLDLSQGGTSELDVFVTPQFGFFGFLAATTMSLLAGHILVYSHRRAELKMSAQSSPSEHIFEHSFRVDGEPRQLSRIFRFILLSIFVATTCLLGVGITRKSFVFEFGGLAGAALRDGARSKYSLLSLGTSLSGSVEKPTSAGILFLQLAYYFYAVVMPFGCLLLLCLLLIWPMTVRRQLVIVTLAEITNAWSAVEVFALSIVAALLEISTFASFIIGDRCDLIDKILADHKDEIGLSTCYTVNSTVSRDSAFLIAAVLLNSAWVSLVLRLVHVALEERMEDSRDDNDGPNLSDQHEDVTEPTFVERLAGWRWTSWMIARPGIDVAVASPEVEIQVGPPVLASPEQVVLPWQTPQNRGVFEEEWKASAEKDPAWKEWKETTNVT